jgi:hypothetical protein
MTMELELDDLQRSWAAQNQRLDEALRLNRQLLSRTELSKVRSAMQRLRVALGVELAMGAVGVLALGSFAADYHSEPRFMIPAVVLLLVALGLFASTVAQRVKAGAIDYDVPVTAIQRRVEELRVSRIRTTQQLLLIAPLLWTPLMIVGMRMLGADAYQLLGAGYLIANLLLGLALIPILIWASRRLAGRFGNSPFAQRLARDVAGANLSAALERLAGITAFEHEDRAP